MNIGECVTLATIYRRIPAVSDFDNTTEQWVLVATARVKLRPLQGTELVEARQLSEFTTHEVWLPYSTKAAEITGGCRMAIGDRTFYFTSVWNHENRNHWIRGMVTEQR